MILRVGAGDPRLDGYRHVGDPAWLQHAGLFVAEGRLVVERLLGSPDFHVESIAVTPAALDALESHLAAAPCDVYVCGRTLLEGVTGFDFHRGCLALARRPAARPCAALLDARRLIALEGVGNPDNVGGIFRSAAAFGAGGIVLDPDSGDPLYRKSVRTSMGATLRVPWVRADAWPDALGEFQRRGFTLVALTPDPGAIPLDEFSATVRGSDRLMLLLGAEGSGLSARTIEMADVRVRIPIDSGVDSLNVVVAAGIALERLRPEKPLR